MITVHYYKGRAKKGGGGAISNNGIFAHIQRLQVYRVQMTMVQSYVFVLLGIMFLL